LSYSQLDAIFGAEHLRGAGGNIRTWGQLGLPGEWRDRPISLYQGLLDAAPAFYFSKEVMKGSLLWNERTRVFDDVDLPGGKTRTAGTQIVEALAGDRYGMALAGVGAATPGVKLLAIARADSGPWVSPSLATICDRSYPLARSVWIYINRAPGAPIDPKVREFLSYILSQEGQRDVENEGEYLPLPPKLVQEQRGRVE
jgi:phosphate transport system substrate-binding protein